VENAQARVRAEQRGNQDVIDRWELAQVRLPAY
jgi:hypothetical protein